MQEDSEMRSPSKLQRLMDPLRWGRTFGILGCGSRMDPGAGCATADPERRGLHCSILHQNTSPNTALVPLAAVRRRCDSNSER